jgi:hypothetical protein
MKQIFFAILSAAIPLVTQAQEQSYVSVTEQRCDGVVISCLHQLDDSSSGSCIMVLPDDRGGMEYDFKDDKVVEFGESFSESYLAGDGWDDIIVIRDDFLERQNFALWNGPDEHLSVCHLLS